MEPATPAHGLGVDAEGYGIVKEHRLHQLLRHSGQIEDRTLAIQFLDGGVETFSFIFG
jgi:Thioredoxin like C-terminal domain